MTMTAIEVYRAKPAINPEINCSSAFLSTLLFNAWRGYIRTVGPSDPLCGHMYYVFDPNSTKIFFEDEVQEMFDQFVIMVMTRKIDDYYSQFLLRDACINEAENNDILFSTEVINSVDEVASQIDDRVKLFAPSTINVTKRGKN
jgi:hypothetical protein